MNSTQEKILELATQGDIEQYGLRELARKLDVHPQTAKYHKERLIQSGALKGPHCMASVSRKCDEDILGGADLIAIPYLGAANCGPAQYIAGAEPEGTVTLSSRLLSCKKYASLFALKADGQSMNQASIDGNCIDTGDYVIVETDREPKAGDCVVAVVNGLANIKQYKPEYANGELTRITLLSQSDDDYDPIFIHPDDQAEGLIAGIAVQVIKRPQ